MLKNAGFLRTKLASWMPRKGRSRGGTGVDGEAFGGWVYRGLPPYSPTKTRSGWEADERMATKRHKRHRLVGWGLLVCGGDVFKSGRARACGAELGAYGFGAYALCRSPGGGLCFA